MPSLTPSTSIGPVTPAGSGSALGAAIVLLTLLFIAATGLFLTRDVFRMDMLHRTISPRSQADYAFTLEQRVAPQRVSISYGAD